MTVQGSAQPHDVQTFALAGAPLTAVVDVLVAHVPVAHAPAAVLLLQTPFAHAAFAPVTGFAGVVSLLLPDTVCGVGEVSASVCVGHNFTWSGA